MAISVPNFALCIVAFWLVLLFKSFVCIPKYGDLLKSYFWMFLPFAYILLLQFLCNFYASSKF